MEEQIQEASNINPVALGVLLFLGCLTWGLPRRFAACPLLIMTCLMPMGQQLIILNLHFHLFRILLLIGLLRVFIRGEITQLKLTRMDKLFLWWAMVSIMLGSLSDPSMALFVNRAGDVYNALACYFFVRCVIVDFEDVVVSVRTLAFMSLPIAALMLLEKTTTHNLLSVFGGVPEITAIRDGHLRCQGAFRHPILAGIFGATQIPLFAALWFYRSEYRRVAIAAIISSLVIVVTASSSGALLALLAAMGGLFLWRWKKYMSLIRWSTLAAILSLAIVMEAPVWYLMAKLSNVMGGTGWHRAWLIDQTIAHFDEWWLFGTTYTAHWGPGGEVIAADPNMMDITNHYVMEGVKGGVLKLGLFLALIIQCFRGLGRRLRAEQANPPVEFFIWGIGVSFFTHCLSFMSANYFDQTILIWFWLQAIICCVGNTAPLLAKPIGASLLFPTASKIRRYSFQRMSMPPSLDVRLQQSKHKSFTRSGSEIDCPNWNPQVLLPQSRKRIDTLTRSPPGIN